MPFPVPETLFDRLAPRLPPLPAMGWTLLAGVGLAAGTTAVAFHHSWLGAGLLLAGFLADGVGQAAGRAVGQVPVALLPLGNMLAPFGFAEANLACALAAMFLLFSLAVLMWVSERRVRLIHWLAALALLIACLLPDRFSILAYIVGIACFLKAGQVLA
jgi:hypothetical protein